MKWTFNWGRPRTTNSSSLTQLQTLVNSLNSQVTNLNTHITGINAQLTTLAPKVSPTFNVTSGQPVKIMTPNNNNGYIEFFRNNASAGYIGLGSSNSSTIHIGNRNGEVKFEPSNNQVNVSNSRLLNVATPTSATDGANKSYVDTAISNIPSSQLYFYRVTISVSFNNAMLNTTITQPRYIDNISFTAPGDANIAALQVISWVQSPVRTPMIVMGDFGTLGTIGNTIKIMILPCTITSVGCNIVCVAKSSTRLTNLNPIGSQLHAQPENSLMITSIELI